MQHFIDPFLNQIMAKVEVVMPQMGESVTEGTVLTWHKQVGDVVEVDEVLLEIGTDKVDSEIPSPATGKIAALLVPEGETVEVGTPIAILETDVNAAIDAPQAVAPAAPVATAPVVAAPVASTPAPVAAATEAPTAAVSGGTLVPVVMPKMGESVMEGTVLTWHKKIGEAVALDETLLEIGTDKVDSEIPSPYAGILAQILVPEGETVEVGTPLAMLATGDGASVSAAPSPAPASVAPAAVASPAPAAIPAASVAATDARFYSPLVREMAKVEGVSSAELATISGSGHEGRVTKKDMQQFLTTKSSGSPVPSLPVAAPAAAKPSPFLMPSIAAGSDEGRIEIIEMDRMRQIIAEHMIRSQATSAHVTSFAEIDVTNLVRLRDRNKDPFRRREGVALTFTPFFIMASIQALREFPYLNASVEGNKIILKKDYHIGMAVALQNNNLIVPCIRNAGTMNIVGLSHAVSDVADRARNKQLLPDELQGGTFTVTNVGSLGSVMGTPLINQPQVAIMATGAIKKRPVVLEIPGVGDTIAIRHIMYASLSYDHRIIDGAMGTSFLRKFTEVIEGIDPNADL